MLVELSDSVYWQFCLVSVFQCMKFFPGQYIGSFLRNLSFPDTSVMKFSLIFLPFLHCACLPAYFSRDQQESETFPQCLFSWEILTLCAMSDLDVSAHSSAAQTCHCNNSELFLMKLLLYYAYLHLVKSRSFWIHADLPAKHKHKPHSIVGEDKKSLDKIKRC